MINTFLQKSNDTTHINRNKGTLEINHVKSIFTKKLEFFRKLSLPIIWASSIVVLQAQTATVNLTSTKQTIDGFGASTAFHGKITTKEADAGFGNNNNNQLGLSILRVEISPGGETYWGDELSNAKYAIERGAIILATPWTPPASMKTNNSVVDGELKTSSYGAYANYLKSYRTYMANNGAPISVISIQNEPDIKVKYSSCVWSAAQMQTFLANNASTIGGNIMAAESWHYDKAYTDVSLNNSKSAANLSHVGIHLYDASSSTYTNAIDKGKKVWMTEHYYNADDISTCMTMAKEIMDCMNDNMNAYIWWYLRLNDCNIINSDGSIKKKGYIMGQFSKYIRPGYKRVTVNYNPQTGVFVCAFKGTDKCIVVALNQNKSSVNQNFTLQNGTVANMVKYTTSSSKSLASGGSVAVSNGSFSASLDAQSVTTFVADLVTEPTITLTSPANNAAFVTGTTITLTATAASTSAITNVRFYDGTTLLSTDNSSPYSYSWTTATAGKHMIRAVLTDNNGKTAADTINIKVNPPQAPYGGTAWPIPGIIQAENFDIGGNGFAYYDSKAGNETGANFRTDEDVDVETCTDTDGGYNLAYTVDGEWLEYTVNVAATASYNLSARVASIGTGGSLHVEMDGTNISGSMTVPNTGGWQSWQTVTVKNINLTAGKHTMKIVLDASWFNLNYVQFSSTVVTDLDAEDLQNSLLAAPNPFENDFTLNIDKPFTYKVYNLEGNLMEEGESTGYITVGQNLNKGIYLLTIQDNAGIKSLKIHKK